MNAPLFALVGTLGIWELLIIFFIVLLIFGANRLSGLGRGMGQAIRGFKEEIGKKPRDKDEDVVGATGEHAVTKTPAPESTEKLGTTS